MDRLSEAVLEYAQGNPEGYPVLAKVLLHLGKRSSIDQVLSRLARRGKLYQAGWGLYFLPVESRFGSHAPSVPKIVKGLRDVLGERIAITGGMAAHLFGLTKHVPVRYVFLTSGSSRKLMLNKLTIEFRHAPAWQVVLCDSVAGDAIRALAWWGNEGIEDAIVKVRERLNAEDCQKLKSVRSQLPDWLAATVSEVAHD